MLSTYILLSLVRFLIPLSILKWPLLGTLASIYIDVNDFGYLNIQNSAQMENYQVWDKIFDTYYLSLAAFVSLKWKEALAKKISIYSFLWRLLGVLIFPLVSSRSLLIFFPNFFENFFLFFLIHAKLTGGKKLLTSRLDTFIILSALLIPSVAREYFMHVIKNPPWHAYNLTQILKIQNPPFDVSYWGWIVILMFLPVLALIWKVFTKRS